jgi:hypothetical protein
MSERSGRPTMRSEEDDIPYLMPDPPAVSEAAAQNK